MAINTGMRAGEIWGLKPLDFCFNEDGLGDTLFIKRQLNNVTKQLGPLKGECSSDKDKSRHVPCSKELRVELEELVKKNKISPEETVFQSIFGNSFNHDSFTDRFNRDLKNWGGKRLRFHDLRHTAATLMLSKGVDIKTLQDILGHENVETTMIYVHTLGNRIKQVSKTFSIKPDQKNEEKRAKLCLVSAN